MKKIKNKLQQMIKNIKTFFINKLCVSLKKETNIVATEEKFCKFEDNFKHEFYMANKKEIDDIKRLGLLTNKLREYTIGYSDINELRLLLSELSTKMTLEKFDKLIQKLGYNNIDDLLNKINNYKNLDFANQLKISNFIGTISGNTMLIQKNFIIKYKKQKNGK